MSQRAPQTLSVKRKRTEAPVDVLIFDNSIKRQRSEADIFFRRLTKPGDTTQESGASTPTTERRFHLDPISRARSKHVFIEHRVATQDDAPPDSQHTPVPQPTPHEPARPRKRPGTRAASTATPSHPTQHATHRTQPSEHDREPSKAAALAQRDSTTAMDLDEADYVIDTYIRESLPSSTSGSLPASLGIVGLLVLPASDDAWWCGTDSSDSPGSDSDDSNAEEYYANDYPEDELSDDDEFGRDPYKRGHRRGSDEEEFDAGLSDDVALASGEDEDDLHYKMTVPKAQRTGYWGMAGQ
ncbi:hypothetical protein EJ07DRAFT_181377 [Lizonia empirigonia]|nr:hypothetical protein EJ07DRAFT_181377 [Lizonia empirigonia]